jgi:hypothetical protein
LPQTSHAQGLLDETGTSILAPSVAPTGGYAQNPQEYLSVAWSVVENQNGVYTYSYTLNNPANDVLLNNDGSLTGVPESFNYFTMGFNTTVPGALVPNSLSGGAFSGSDPLTVYWFFAPAVGPGGTSATVSFASDLAPAGLASGTASEGGPPSPWSSVSPGGQLLPVPALATVPEPATTTMFAFAAPFLFMTLRSVRASSRKL